MPITLFETWIENGRVVALIYFGGANEDRDELLP